jgi:AcrR family transcriptional regulator
VQVIPSQINLSVNDRIFLKNPESSELGKKIISGSIELIDEMGIENFTFRKLSKHIDSTEASIYRYFESKHRLLIYLIAWYWSWVDFRLMYLIANLEDPKEKLRRAIRLLTEKNEVDSKFLHVDEVKLHRIIISEASKTYLTKGVDQENSEGLFKTYKQLVERVSDLILEINPHFDYPHMLVSTVIEGAHHQRFFADHLPRLTDQLDGEDSIIKFYQKLVFSCIKSTAN